jgi:hypothetical protein
MYENHDPKWLQLISRHLRWLAIPNLAAALIVSQICGFLVGFTHPEWLNYLVLDPERVWQHGWIAFFLSPSIQTTVSSLARRSFIE